MKRETHEKRIFECNEIDHYKMCLWHLRRCGLNDYRFHEICNKIDEELIKSNEMKTIQKAIESMNPIIYEPQYIAYFVTIDGCDMGGEDYCEKCIDEAMNLSKNDDKTKDSCFSYEGHDPDFSGGRTEPNTCNNCGEAFQTEFTANKEEANHLLRVVNKGNITDREKWELEIALYHYQYSDFDVQKILMRVAKKFLISTIKINETTIKHLDKRQGCDA